MPQAHKGRAGLSVSGREVPNIGIDPRVTGNRQDQQISVMGFTNLPVQLAAEAKGDFNIISPIIMRVIMGVLLLIISLLLV